jgi:hypothetical protein
MLNASSTVVPDFDDSRKYGADDPGIAGLLTLLYSTRIMAWSAWREVTDDDCLSTSTVFTTCSCRCQSRRYGPPVQASKSHLI